MEKREKKHTIEALDMSHYLVTCKGSSLTTEEIRQDTQVGLGKSIEVRLWQIGAIKGF